MNMKIQIVALALVLFLSVASSQRVAQNRPGPTKAQCAVPYGERKICGDLGMSPQACRLGNCCVASDGTCYKAKGVKTNFQQKYQTDRQVTFNGLSRQTPVVKPKQNAPVGGEQKNMINMMVILQMKKDGVSQNIINALLADSVPNGEMLYYMADGKISMEEMMSMQDMPTLELDAMQTALLQGGDIKSFLYSQLGESYGMDPVVMKLLMSGESDIVKEHLMTKISMPADPMSRLVFRSVLSGEKLTKQGIMDHIIDNMLSNNFDYYTTTAFKALLGGNKKLARTFLMLGQMKNFNVKVEYPRNEAIFASFVKTQADHPGKINPTMIFKLAMNEKIPALTPDLSFSELFGVSAFDYVCAVHSPDLQTPCRALPDGGSSLDCFNAGCCLRDNPDGGKPICYENILGNIGVGMAASIWDEDYIVNTIFKGNLPELSSFYPDGIPWLVSTSAPAFVDAFKARDPAAWWNSLSPLGGLRNPIPTGRPNVQADAFNPNFQWQPHGVTPFPFPTQAPDLPAGVPAVTSAPGEFGGNAHAPVAAPGPVVVGLSLDTFPGCYTTAIEDRIPCMGNEEAWTKTGETKCANIGCCYNKDISDPSVPACFSSRDRGQCHNVADEEKIDCGKPGITADECLSDARCCYDSTTKMNGYKSVPWCYYKKYSFLPSDVRCKAVADDKRVACFPKKGLFNFNTFVSETTCEAAGCCYDKVGGLSFLQLALGAKAPPSCYKMLDAPIQKLDPAPQPAPDAVKTSVCEYRNVLDPAARVDCGNVSEFECTTIFGCCYEIETMIPGVPFCFKKSEV